MQSIWKKIGWVALAWITIELIVALLFVSQRAYLKENPLVFAIALFVVIGGFYAIKRHLQNKRATSAE